MSELISGKEALIALANGEEVEVRHPHDKWYKNWESLNGSGGKFFLLYLLDESIGYQFRLKPRTTFIHGIEVPAPFEPKEGERFYYITDEVNSGYSSSGERGFPYIAVWRTEEEIKQVVAALHQVFNPQ